MIRNSLVLEFLTSLVNAEMTSLGMCSWRTVPGLAQSDILSSLRRRPTIR